MTIIFGTPEANKLALPYMEPCPFCGKSEHLSVDKGRAEGEKYFYVRCDCDARGPTEMTESAAVVEWNKRAVRP